MINAAFFFDKAWKCFGRKRINAFKSNVVANKVFVEGHEFIIEFP